jgi:predicted nucleic acid-binding Zn finger protein
MSANTIRKAKKLVESDGVVKIDQDIYQIKSSSDPNKSYIVTADSCECPGFKNFYKFHHGKGIKANCSHLEAVRIFKKENQ